MALLKVISCAIIFITSKVPVGKNILVSLMTRISKGLELSQTDTNHCIRTTTVSLLDECNFEASHIMRVSGHKSGSSIRSYSRRLSEVKQKQISETLSSPCCNDLEASTSSELVLVKEAQNEAEETLFAESSRTTVTTCMEHSPFCITHGKALPLPVNFRHFVASVIQKHTKFANFASVYFPYFTIFRDQTWQFYQF